MVYCAYIVQSHLLSVWLRPIKGEYIFAILSIISLNGGVSLNFILG